MDVRKKLIVARVLGCWNRLTSEVVEVPYLEIIKVSFDGALSNPIYLGMSLLIAEESD